MQPQLQQLISRDMNLLAILFLGTAHGFGSAPSTDRMEGTFTLEDGSLLPYEAQVPIP